MRITILVPKAFLTAIGVVLAASYLFVRGVHGQPVDIREYQPIDLRSLDESQKGDASTKTARPRALTFVAFGERFEIMLESNSRLIERLPPAEKKAAADVELFRGSLVGVEGSWVRLTRSPGRASGLIWDGTELFGIAPASDVVASIPNGASPKSNSTVVYRVSGTPTDLGDLLMGAPAMSAFLAPNAMSALESNLAAGKQVEVGLVADYEFVLAAPATARARVLEIVNNADAIFLRNLGIHLSVGTIELFDSANDPFTTNEPTELLVQLANHKETTPALRGHGLVHLFTGREFVAPATGSLRIAGVANFGSVCDVRTSVALTRAVFGSSTDALITAHEIGHNFGAPHDGEPTSPCATTPTTFLMAPELNGSGEFSECSIAQMQPEILGAACLTPLPLADVEGRPFAPPALSMKLGAEWNLSATIQNVGATDALLVDIDISATGLEITRFNLSPGVSGLEFTCNDNPRRCRIVRLPPGSTVSVTVDFKATAAGLGALTFGAHALNDANATNDRVEYAVTVVPAVDVDIVDPSALSSRVRYLRPLHPTTLRLDLVNRSPIPATNVRFTLDVIGSVQLALDNPMRDGCVQAHASGWTCTVGVLGSLETRQHTVTLQAPAGSSGGTSSVHVNVTSAEPDTDSVDAGFVPYQVVDKLIDLAVTLAPPPPLVAGQVQLAGTLTNRGPDSATGLELTVAANLLSIVSVATGRGPCSPLGAPTNWICRIPNLNPGETVPLTVDATGNAGGHYRVDLFARAQEVDEGDSDNFLQSEFQLLEPPVPPAQPPTTPPASSSGGGGTTGGCELLLLASLLVVRARRKRLRHWASLPPWTIQACLVPPHVEHADAVASADGSVDPHGGLVLPHHNQSGHSVTSHTRRHSDNAFPMRRNRRPRLGCGLLEWRGDRTFLRPYSSVQRCSILRRYDTDSRQPRTSAEPREYWRPSGVRAVCRQIEIDEADSGDRRRACADSSASERFSRAARQRSASRSPCGSPPCRSPRSRNLV